VNTSDDLLQPMTPTDEVTITWRELADAIDEHLRMYDQRINRPVDAFEAEALPLFREFRLMDIAERAWLRRNAEMVTDQIARHGPDGVAVRLATALGPYVDADRLRMVARDLVTCLAMPRPEETP
jgi:hypothetical protein